MGPCLDWCEGNWKGATLDESSLAALIEQGIDPNAKPEVPEGEEPPPVEEPVDPCTYTIAWWPADAEPEEGEVSEFTEPTLPRKALRKADAWKGRAVALAAERALTPGRGSATIPGTPRSRFRCGA